MLCDSQSMPPLPWRIFCEVKEQKGHWHASRLAATLGWLEKKLNNGRKAFPCRLNSAVKWQPARLACLFQLLGQSLISVHCVCHKVALACTDTLSDLFTIKQVQNTLNTLWRLLDNSNKKTSIFLKVQLHMNDITLTNKNSKRKVLSSAFNLVATPDLSPTITLAPSDTKLLNHVKLRPCFSMTLRRTPVMVSESALSELARTFSRHRNFTSTFSLLLL